MCRINNAAGYAAGTTAAMTTDDNLPAGDVTTVIIQGMRIWAKNPAQHNAVQFLGTGTNFTGTSVRINDGTGTRFAIEDNAEFYVEDPAQLAYTLAVARGFILTAANTSGVEVSEDGRGNLTYTFWDMS
tara:strand:- start:26571 stop:26957 length:387 start_codon:yes stop_codon:yes gene_type:complete